MKNDKECIVAKICQWCLGTGYSQNQDEYGLRTCELCLGVGSINEIDRRI